VINETEAHAMTGSSITMALRAQLKLETQDSFPTLHSFVIDG